jgi:hypothetical protein
MKYTYHICLQVTNTEIQNNKSTCKTVALDSHLCKVSYIHRQANGGQVKDTPKTMPPMYLHGNYNS